MATYNRDEFVEEVSQPGKFEGCAPHVPYFWQLFLEGMAGEDEGDTVVFTVEPEDKELFPELQLGERVVLEEDNVGFVSEIPF